MVTSVTLLFLSSLFAVAGEFEEQTLQLINSYRNTNRLQRLDDSPLCEELARQHSREMLKQQEMNHNGADGRFRQAAAKGATGCVENVAWNMQTPQKLFDAWRHSPGHDRNLLNRRMNAGGIGKAGEYVTFFACEIPIKPTPQRR
jgi:uncharacterized protein YkwD